MPAADGTVQRAPADGQAPAAGARAGPTQGIFGIILRLGLMYSFMMFMRGGKKTDSSDSLAPLLRPLAGRGHTFTADFFISTQPDHYGTHVWNVPTVTLPSADARASIVLDRATLTPVIERNESLYLVARFAPPGHPLPTGADASQPIERSPSGHIVFSVSHDLIAHHAFDPEGGKKSLLDTSSAAASQARRPVSGALDPELDGQPVEGSDAPETVSAPLVPHFKPNLTIEVVDYFATSASGKIPPPMRDALVFDDNHDGYYPVVQSSEFWLLRSHLVPLNDTVDSVTLHLHLQGASTMWWSLQLGLRQQQESKLGFMQASQFDEAKRIFLEGNPYFLALTLVVSLLHTVFDALAFKSDVGFWKANKSMEGLSARTVLINAGCQVVVFLYVLNNETSMLILGSVGMGMLIEFWKVTKVFNVSVATQPGALPRLKFEDRTSYVDSNTKKWDDDATRYMMLALVPCVVGYFIWSLLYEKHKGWYSFILQTLVGFVYAFGFVLMVPQLYLNYKLKSVAHLPWRQMTYKFLNTIVDDLGAFIIKAPTLYRLAVFRDDVIFLIYIYQRWIYRVDKSRVNEFGFSDRPPEETGTIEGASASARGQGAVCSAEGPHAAEVAGTSTSVGAARRKNANKQVPAADAGRTLDETAKGR